MGITFSQGIKGINHSHFSDDSLLLGGTPFDEAYLFNPTYLGDATFHL